MIGLLLAMLEEGYSDRTATSNVGGGLQCRTIEEGYSATSNVGGGLQ